jgi:paraquat-inducible protein B
MKGRKPNATLVGAFAVLGLVLLVAAIIAAGGGKLFARKERVVMYFSGSIYGLSVGAPVNFRGVRLGQVSSIGLVYDRSKDDFIIPVVADLEPDAVRGMAAAPGNDPNRSVLTQMVARGLKAQLSMQSLLTGLLYIDLDLRPTKPSVLRGTDEHRLEIPTTTTSIQQLKNQLDGLDLRRLMDDISAIADSARNVLAGPQLKQVMSDLVSISTNARSITAKLDARIGPLASSATRAADKVGTAADNVSDTAGRLGSAADRYRELVAPGSPLIISLQQTADELAKAASALREDMGEDGPLIHNADRALQDVSRAARSVRELADLLDQHPDALLRGRPADPLAQDKTLKPRQPP